MRRADTENINDNFFQGIYKEVWRKLIPPGLSEAEMDFIQETAQLNTGSFLLDLMCGYGRHTLIAARKGISVTAVDNSRDYIDQISSVGLNENLPVESLCSGVMNFIPEKKYDAAICMGNSFAFFSKEESLSVLKMVSSALKPGGKFIINTWMIAEIAIRYFKERDWYYIDGYKYLTDNTFLFNPTRIETDHIIIADNGKVESIRGIDYIFTLNELREMFNFVNLSFENIYSTPRKKKFMLGDTRAYIVASKNQA